MTNLAQNDFKYSISIDSQVSEQESAPTLNVEIFNISKEFTNNFLEIRPTQEIVDTNGYKMDLSSTLRIRMQDFFILSDIE